MSANSSSLRPGWYKGAGGGGGRGFQPPPTVTSERGDKSRSSSWGSQERKDSNKFSALQDDDDAVNPGNGKGDDKPSGNSRSEAFRSSFSRSASTGEKRGGGRSLADLAARVPESATTGRRLSAGYDSAGRSSGRFTGLRPGESSAAGDNFKPDPKVVRYTREKLLSMRPSPRGPDPGPPEDMMHLEGAVIISQTCQDPVCWDVFEAEGIWESYRERRLSGGAPKPVPAGIGRPVELVSEDPRRRNIAAPSSGRWQRGVALPPAEEGGRRKERDAENPNELWDDPMVTGAAADFSAFGGIPEDHDAFDFDKMAEASKQLEEEIPEPQKTEEELEEERLHAVKVDPNRPLASAGMTLTSGSGDDVNVFEDFDAPAAEANAANTTIRGGDEDPTASSRLMKMIGVTREPDTGTGDLQSTAANPWGVPPADEIPSRAEASTIDPIISSITGAAGLAGVSSTIPLNPWGAPAAPQPAADSGMDLAASLEAFAAEQKAREAQVAVEMKKMAEQEELRRRQEEEAQRRALAQRQAEERARQQQAAALQQQQASHQSQVEIVLMERICSILENSWGRSDLGSVLSTLHSEDSRVVPLLGNVDALRALIARSPQRVALRHDPSFGGDMAVLLMTNTQWQQQQQVQARLQQEELHRRRVEEEKAAARAKAQEQSIGPIDPDLPWFYSDPQNNIQGPFRGEEMRQWLEAGYFKGDLPISQQSSGPFHALSAIFPDLTIAFRAQIDSGAQEEAERAAAEEERARKEAAEEEERRLIEAEEAKARKAAEVKRAEEEAAAATVASSNGGNEPSTQLKMMLGLSAESMEGASTQTNEMEPAPEPPKQKSSEKRSSKGNKKAQQKATSETVDTESLRPAESATKLSSTAWGGAASAKPKKSMSEIQQEEARAAAIMAMQKDSFPKQSSSGWANVAASGTAGWSSGTLKQAPPAGAQSSAAPSASRGPVQRAKTQGAAPSRPPAPIAQQQRSSSVSSTPAEEFGATMSPVMENWCKEQMQSINGSDDLTLVAFCMTLTDANEIRQYLTTYLGSTAQVNNFATEFINKRGLGTRQEEWETPGSAKKSRKKKAGAR
eukprot:CAMPEP_0117003288 /NCGR_PEP_ID=MMETSP0472-20121206/4654_1 /TAXON_ID=693140 ORGANISM="Tiarina fusus, Strain LIS" /NCGR_SAMPLE_ID=MMETSP0472 /ASSEMBLY_ACC=CAM_ASM_000603 /LENGTH=1077 /DNA_ID=CAMNT_0004703879 /DNA_START=46 /DNA_END=3279 /DNA_ORIENTATION=-